MSGCYEAGRIVVIPKDPNRLSGVLETSYDVARAVDARLPDGNYPKLVSVSPGDEVEHCARLVQTGAALAATPNFYVDPAMIRLDQRALEGFVHEIAGQQYVNPTTGAGIRIAVLDSGWSRPSWDDRTPTVQVYLSDDPSDRGLTDATGHGTVVTEIVRRLAPAADVRAFRVTSRIGTLWTVVGGLLQAESVFQPDLINLSLAFKCDPTRCSFCNRRDASPAQIDMILRAFCRQPTGGEPVFVAAAGNRKRSLAMPAALDGVIAVGAFDPIRGTVPAYAVYDSVPAGRFVMAPGGSTELEQALAFTRTPYLQVEEALCGTSFAAPVVTAVAAAYMAEANCNRRTLPDCDLRSWLIAQLDKSADCSFPGYDITRHGLGLVRYSPGSAHYSSAHPPAQVSAGGSSVYRYRSDHESGLLRWVAETAHAIYEAEGRPDGRADQHWHRARRRRGIPDRMWL
jgi:hypothetical protein